MPATRRPRTSMGGSFFIFGEAGVLSRLCQAGGDTSVRCGRAVMKENAVCVLRCSLPPSCLLPRRATSFSPSPTRSARATSRRCASGGARRFRSSWFGGYSRRNGSDRPRPDAPRHPHRVQARGGRARVRRGVGGRRPDVRARAARALVPRRQRECRQGVRSGFCDDAARKARKDPAPENRCESPPHGL